jgi:hypothetical protein
VVGKSEEGPQDTEPIAVRVNRRLTKMANGNGTTWFEAIMDLIYAQMFTQGSRIYLPDIIQNGYTGDGLDIPPMDSTAVPDWSVPDLQTPVPDSCSAGQSSGDANFKATGQTLSGFHTVAQNGPLAFANNDQSLVINLTVQTLVLSGSFESDQLCTTSGAPGAWIEPYTGTFRCTITNTDLTVTVSISVGAALQISVDSIAISPLTAGNLDWKATCQGCKLSQLLFFENLLTTVEVLDDTVLQTFSDTLNSHLNSAAVRNDIASLVNAQLARL